MKAKKSLGQNFLRDPKILKKIADFARIENTDTVVEIGPGEGTLTKLLLERAGHVVAIEKDNELAEQLKEKFQKEISQNKLEVIEGDILGLPDKFFSIFFGEKSAKYKLIGNIPYYITGALFKKFLESSNPPSSLTFVIQKEVAERIMARDGKESILSVSIKAYGKPEYGGLIKAGSFSPAPKVDSAIIAVRDINKQNFQQIKESKFFEIIKTGFAHKRKFLIKNLSETFATQKLDAAFDKCALSSKVRAEDLALEDWLRLTTCLMPHSEFWH